MDGAINFTIGLSEGIAWPWPIAVYLFLAGISGGAVAVALMLNFFRHKTETTPIIKSASIIGLATILLGMLCLVLDLTNPLYFWRILVYYNPTSVMSIGVMLLLFYIPLVAVLMVMSFADTFSKWPLLGWVKPVCDRLEKFRVWINAVVMVLAIAICAYTGFLISALIRFPLINTAVLPALFVASGISAGMAVTKILAAFSAFTDGIWAVVFWVGAVGIGFGIPLIASLIAGKNTESKVSFYFAGTCAIAGMMCLRLFILYAGQMNTIV